MPYVRRGLCPAWVCCPMTRVDAANRWQAVRVAWLAREGGEMIDVVYRVGDFYIPDALDKLSNFPA